MHVSISNHNRRGRESGGDRGREIGREIGRERGRERKTEMTAEMMIVFLTRGTRKASVGRLRLEPQTFGL